MKIKNTKKNIFKFLTILSLLLISSFSYAQENNIIEKEPGPEPEKNLEVEKKIILNISEGQIIQSPLIISGNTNDAWAGFEGELGLVRIKSLEGEILSEAIIKMANDWMENKNAKFYAELEFDDSKEKWVKISFENNNPTGNLELDKKFSIFAIINKNNICTKDFNPVCAEVFNPDCKSEECEEQKKETFSNSCMASVRLGEILHKGECEFDNEETKKIEENERRKEFLKKKTVEVFSKYDHFIFKLEFLIQKVEEKKNMAQNQDWQKIKDDLFEAKNKKAEARLVFSKIYMQENKEDVKKDLFLVDGMFKSLKTDLGKVFFDIKKTLNNKK